MNKLAKILDQEGVRKVAGMKQLQQAIYRDAIQHIVRDKEAEAAALELARTSDAFYVGTFQDLYDVLRSDEGEEEVLDAIHAILIDVGDRVKNYLSNKWNFEPGYQVPSMNLSWSPDERDSYLREFSRLL